MALLSIRDVSLNLSGPQLLDGVHLQIEEGQRVCLLGRNGMGKSTFMKVMHGEMVPDSGDVIRQQGLKIGMLPQEVPQDITGSVFAVVASGLGRTGEALSRHHDASVGLEQGEASAEQNTALTAVLEDAQYQLDSEGGWESYATIRSVLNHLKLEPDVEFLTLSGGVKRRVMLARALASEPDILLLDEPTNHLDVESISWLEEFLLRYVRTLVLVTHDRAFMRKVANRIVELDRGHLADWQCDYDTFLQRKEQLLAAEEKEWDRFDKKLAEEEAWIRQGIKARRTRNMGRVRSLVAMREERNKRRDRLGTVSMQVQEAERSGKLVVEAKGISYRYPDAAPEKQPVVEDFSCVISRGDKVGLIGPNGVGKTTLLRLLLGELEPVCGTIRHGTRLEISYFDQLRGTLDEQASVRHNVANGDDTVVINGRPKHVVGYLKEFLFDPERVQMPVHSLSGGERNRLLLAKLFTLPSNVLVLDEPTNDLDVETLDLLEALLVEYSGTVLVVSHDRAFLDNVVTSTIAFDGHGSVMEYVGGYTDWLRQRGSRGEQSEEKQEKPRKEASAQEEGGARKRTYNEQRELIALQEELAALPERIEALEQEQSTLEAKLTEPDFYTRDPQAFAAAGERLEQLEAEQLGLLERWEGAEQRVEELELYRS